MQNAKVTNYINRTVNVFVDPFSLTLTKFD